MQTLEGKVALVVGGSRGIGAAISRRMVADGASVGIIYLSRADEAERFAKELRDQGGIVSIVQADVTEVAALNDAIDEITGQFGRLDILVSVAGTAIVGPLETYGDDAFDRSFSLNVRAPFLAAKKAASLMTSGGRIITIGSIVADRMPGAGGTLYAASKAALGGMTRGLARDLGKREITANLVQPGPIDIERNPADGPNAADNRTPLAIPRHGTPNEVASPQAVPRRHASGMKRSGSPRGAGDQPRNVARSHRQAQRMRLTEMGKPPFGLNTAVPINSN